MNQSILHHPSPRASTDRTNQMEVATSSTTTWPILHGTLRSCLSLESSLSTPDPPSALSAPLFLQRPPQSPPCDITIVFPKKHVIHQIYVRSTARIYEIYYALNSTSDNVYLCTVRCSLVNESEEVKETDSQFAGDASSGSSNASISEDSWIDVNGSMNSNTSKNSVSTLRTKEDLYEATAEISDADPCISLTLRLLSIQSTDYVCVDEIYVYGDPVDDDVDDTDEQDNSARKTSGSSLMALLAPTLMQLQLSKSGIGSTKDSCSSKQPKDLSSHGIGSQGADIITATHGNGTPPELCSSVSSPQVTAYHAENMAANAAEPKKLHVPTNHDLTTINYTSRIEKALNELISRVIKIEETCSKFEESIRKPICSIEERLSCVEKQLSALGENFQNSNFARGTRFSAPDFSCIESTSNSSDVDGSSPICETSKTVDTTIALPAQPLGNGSSVSMKTVEVPPVFSSAAPQVPDPTHNAEDTDTDPPMHIHGTSLELPKKTVSIDDALASALAAFVSSGHPKSLNKGFSIKAPEYSTSEESENINEYSSGSQFNETTSSIIHEDETEVTQCKETPSFISNSLVNEVQDLADNDPSTEQIEHRNVHSSFRKLEDISQFVSNEGPQIGEHNEICSYDKFEWGAQYVSDNEAHDCHNIVSNKSNDTSADSECTSGEDRHFDNSVYQKTEIEVCDHQQKARNDKEARNQEALLQVTELAYVPSPVNFDTSILDVSFVSVEASSRSSSLEVLLTDTTVAYQLEAPCGAEVSSKGDATTDQDFIPVEKETNLLETTGSTVNNHYFDTEIPSLIIKNNSTESVSEKDLHSNLSLEVFPTSLI